MILDRFKVTDQVAVVTGAGRGLGAATAIALAEAGADVVISSRTESDLVEVAKAVDAAGRRAHIVTADLNDEKAIRALATEAKAAFGRLDIVVNNVGGTYPCTYLDTSVKFLEDAFHFNVGTAHALSTSAVPLMLETGGGSIVNISSAMGRLAGRGFLAYGTAKAALAHYTRLAATDLSPRVRVNGVFVGSIATSALGVVMGNDEIRNAMEKATPLHRIGEPEDIAAAVVYLSSPAGGYITGKLLEVDGGLQYPNFEIPLEDL